MKKTTTKTASAAKLTRNTKVNVAHGEEIYVAVVKKVDGNTITVDYGNGEVEDVNAKHVTIRKRGRKSLAEEMTPAELAAQIKGLLADLRDTDDQDEKKRIRRALRRRGHSGGLNVKAAKRKAATKK